MRKLSMGLSICLIIVALCMSFTGCMIDDSAPALRFEDGGRVDLIVFRCGDAYLTHEKDSLDWLVAFGEIPADICLEDGEFAYVNADISRVSGGTSYYSGNPEFKKVNSFQIVSFEDLVNNEELAVYDPDQKPFHGLGYYVSDAGVYCIAQYHGTYYVYADNACMGVYHTKDDMLNALN